MTTNVKATVIAVMIIALVIGIASFLFAVFNGLMRMM